jgi:hypothetical protein
MPRIGLHPGVYGTSIGLLITGGLAVLSATPVQPGIFWLGVGAIALAILLLIWGLKIDGEHWWARFLPAASRRPHDASTPSRFAALSALQKKSPHLLIFGNYEVPFRELAWRVAFESDWAARYDASDAYALVRQDNDPRALTEYKWQRDLKDEIKRHLGELRSKGVRQGFKEKPSNYADYIPKAFWQRADFEVQHLLTTQTATIAFIPSEAVYREIVFDRSDMDKIWSKRKAKDMKRNPSPFVELASACMEQAEFNAHYSEQSWGNYA